MASVSTTKVCVAEMVRHLGS